ncbi:MAG TPA: pitrilysin family protein, partial [Actinomycetota bacterium]|nr:pitrilysin family protein [Actinomycetota bacterium]
RAGKAAAGTGTAAATVAPGREASPASDDGAGAVVAGAAADGHDAMIVRETLPNGVRLVTEAMPEAQSASVGLWIGIGTRDEPVDLAGASHFLEHLLFKGTPRHTALAIAEAFDAIGGEANAFSTKEYTVVHGRVLAEDLELCCDILSDMVVSPSIRADDVEAERRVVLEEIALRDDTPDDLVFDVFSEAVFGEHPLARPVLGTSESVASLTPSAVRGFHGSGYGAGNIVVAAAGALDHPRIAALVADLLPAGGQPVERRTEEARPGRALRLVPKDSEQVHIVLGGVGYSREHPDRFAWEVLDVLLGGGMSSRLFQEIREQRGMAYSVYSYRDLYQETGMYGVYVGTSPENAAEVLKISEGILDTLAADGPDEAEVVRAKGHLRGSLMLSLEDSANRMSRLGRSELMRGEVVTIDKLLARMGSVTVADVARVAADLLRPEGRVLTIVGPVDEEDVPGW